VAFIVSRGVRVVNGGRVTRRRGGGVDLLLTNDDGVDALGLRTLEAAMAAVGTVWTVAPNQEQSSKGHGFSLHAPVRVETRGERRWAVDGTPADCAYLALHQILPVSPALVVSGINHGSNLGGDVFYSGTVAAAMEANFQGFPSIAVSLHRIGDHPLTWFTTAAQVVVPIVRGVLEHGLPPRVCLNVNVPDVPQEQLRGVRVCAQGWRHYQASVERRLDPRGQPYYWLGGAHRGFEPVPGTDGPLVEEGWATVTPLHDVLSTLRGWVEAD
jgi:5'-nucleotidase